MELYNYHSETLEYIGTSPADKSPLENDVYLIPAYALVVPPPATGPNEVAVAVGTDWQIQPDHRGETWYQADGTTVTIDSINVTPDPSWTQSPPSKPLADVKTTACAAIDAAAGAARARYITVAAGQELTYLSKAADAEAYRATGYPAAQIASYPWVKAKAEATVPTPGATDYQAAADLILATRDAWVTKGVAIEMERERGKAAVQAATDETEVTAARDAAIAALAAFSLTP